MESYFESLSLRVTFTPKKQLKLLLSISLTTILFLNLFSNLIVYATFKINQDEIAKTLCVLREQKNNTCNGNCVLKAELKKQAEKEQKHENILKEKIESIYTITQNEYKFSSVTYKEIHKVAVQYKSAKPNSVSFINFHPPTV